MKMIVKRVPCNETMENMNQEHELKVFKFFLLTYNFYTYEKDFWKIIRKYVKSENSSRGWKWNIYRRQQQRSALFAGERGT